MITATINQHKNELEFFASPSQPFLLEYHEILQADKDSNKDKHDLDVEIKRMLRKVFIEKFCLVCVHAVVLRL
jgi:hypothetical protein